MARHKRGRRRFRAYLKGQIELDIGLGALAADTAITEPVGDTVTEEAWVSSVKAIYTLQDLPASTGDGPVIVGVAHSDYTLAEIEEWIENTASWEKYDLRQQEIAKRKIRRIGTFIQLSSAEDMQVMNEGRQQHTKCGWMLGTGQTLQFWCYNAGLVLNTGGVVHVRGHANIWPK